MSGEFHTVVMARTSRGMTVGEMVVAGDEGPKRDSTPPSCPGSSGASTVVQARTEGRR
jgi:hypothetical protein